MKRIVILAALLLSGPAFAQQAPQPDPSVLQKVISILQQQRNGAADREAGAMAEVSRLNDENARLKVEIETLKKAATNGQDGKPD